MIFIFNPPIICIQNVFFVKEVLSFVSWFGAIPCWICTCMVPPRK